MNLIAKAQDVTIGYIEIDKWTLDPITERLVIWFHLNDHPMLHYQFGQDITASLWVLLDVDAGVDEDKAKALLMAEKPAFNSVARVAWNLPFLIVEQEN